MSIATKKLVVAITFLLAVCSASAQRNAHFISGSVSELSLVELQLIQVVKNSARKIADYQVTSGKRGFVFAIPDDTSVTYRLQVNIMKLEGRHPKLDRAFTLPLTLNAGQNYTLKIVPSKLNIAKNLGWELKPGPEKSSVAFISGRVTGMALRSPLQLNLQSVKDGSLVSGASVQSNIDGFFEIACPVIQEGFYYLTTVRWRTRLYLKPADRLHIEVNHLTGGITDLDGSYENQTLYQWQQLILPITSYGYNLSIHRPGSTTMNEYIHTYQDLQPLMADFFKKVDKTNPRFFGAFKNAADIDSQLAPMNFLLYYPAKKQNGFSPSNKDFGEVPEFYRQFIRPGKFNSASILEIGEAREFMNTYVKLNMALWVSEQNRKLSPSEKLKRMMDVISNDTLKSMFFNDQMSQIEINNLSEFRETFEPFKKYATLSPAKETYKSIYGLFSGDTAYIGKSSYNFSLPDTSGKMVSMKDSKGKVVFVDVWATWCGPCRAQFPFLKEIEEEYASNKNIVFVGISLDKVELKQKWKDMIKKEGLGGIQLLDDFGKAFGRKYEIAAIPRFMLIDKQGRWIEIRCPRPEAKDDLKRYLDKALAE